MLLNKKYDINRMYLKNIRRTTIKARNIIISTARIPGEEQRPIKKEREDDASVDPYLTSVKEDDVVSVHQAEQKATQSQSVGVDANSVELNQTSFQRVALQDLAGSDAHRGGSADVHGADPAQRAEHGK